MRESAYQGRVIKAIKRMYPGAIVLKNDSAYIQGIPDLLVLDGPHWAALEVKRSADEPVQPNQPYYVEKMNEMSFAAFLYPEVEQEVFNELQVALGYRR